MEGQFLGCVGWVCGGDDSAGPQGSPRQDRGVDCVGCEECEDIAFFPVVSGFETLAEFQRGIFESLVGIVTFGFGVLVEDWSSCDVSTDALSFLKNF